MDRKHRRRSLLVLTLTGIAVASSPAAEPVGKVTASWDKVTRVSQTTPTLQVGVNPPLRRGTPVGDEATTSVRGKAAGESRGLSREEADLLAGDLADPRGSGRLPGPGHEGRPAPLPESPDAGRAGVLGATILNDLVDEIEKDLEIEVERHAPPMALPAYRRAVGCSFAPVTPDLQTRKETTE